MRDWIGRRATGALPWAVQPGELYQRLRLQSYSPALKTRLFDSGTLKTLLPHWHTNHGPRLLVNSAGKALVDSAVPASLSAGIKYLRDLSEEDAPDTIYIKSRKSKKKGAKRDAEEADVQSERE